MPGSTLIDVTSIDVQRRISGAAVHPSPTSPVPTSSPPRFAFASEMKVTFPQDFCFSPTDSAARFSSYGAALFWLWSHLRSIDHTATLLAVPFKQGPRTLIRLPPLGFHPHFSNINVCRFTWMIMRYVHYWGRLDDTTARGKILVPFYAHVITVLLA